MLHATKLLPLLLAATSLIAQTSVTKPGIKTHQTPFTSLKPTATFNIGGTADWVLIADNAIWVASTKPYSLQRIDPRTNKLTATITLPGEACSGLAFGFGSIWVPICGKKPTLARVDTATNKIIQTLPVGSAGHEGGITASDDSIWLVTDKKGTLTRINPATNSVRQRITIAPGSFNPLFDHGTIWITSVESNLLIAVDANTGAVQETIPIGPKPRFLTAGSGSIWTLNQGDGTISRVDEQTRKLLATIPAGIPGPGGDIAYAANSIWASVFHIPLTLIDAEGNNVTRQWTGRGGDSLRCTTDSIWLTDYRRGLLWRIPIPQAH